MSKVYSNSEIMAAVAAHKKFNYFVPNDIINMFDGVKGATMAHLVRVAPVTLAAANKDKNIVKVSFANVVMANEVSPLRAVYENKVKRTATQIGHSPEKNIDKFQSQDSYFEHVPGCFSLARHKVKKDQYYLFTLANSTKSYYVEDDFIVSRTYVASLQTPSAAEKTLNSRDLVYNVSYDVLHNAIVRLIKLENVVSLRANKQELKV